MKKSILLLFIVSLTACEMVVDIDVPFDGEQLTVNSFFNPDSLFHTTVSLNRFVLDRNPFQRVGNATVWISDESGPVDTLHHIGNGLYRSDTGKPQIGKSYTFAVSTDAHGTSTGQSQIPVPAPVSDVTIQTPPFGSNLPARISLTITDDISTANNYVVSVEVASEFLDPYSYEIITQRSVVPLGVGDEDFGNEEERIDNALLVKDVFFSSAEINISVESPDWYLAGVGTVIVTVKTLSDDYYKYVTTSRLQNNTSGNPFAQPVNVYSNIQNGFGIVAGFSASSFIQSKPRPVITNVPSAVRRGDQIIITAEHLEPVQSNLHVIFEGSEYPVYGQISGFNGSSITFLVPPAAISGRLWLQANGKVVEWEPGITITN